MELFSSLPSLLRIVPVLLFGCVYLPSASAQTLITSEYIYIGIEAEDHVNKNERWVLTTPSTPTEENDPDGNHSDQASGSTYLELLPDIRVTHDDAFGPPLAYWGQGGQGPDADYLVNFPEPGRYYVHVRAYSTGTEDNGLHVGLNGTWPQSGQRMQFCTAHRRAWWWSSAQRDAGGNGSCGIEKSIWLDVPSAGQHTLSISAREDGFEIDRLALLKDLSGNTRICEPTTAAATGVSCRNGSIESADDFVDLRVRLETLAVGADPEVEPPNPLEVEAGNNIELTARIENLDAFDTATDIVLTLTPAAGEWTMIDMDNRCTEEGDEFKCTLNELHPTAPNENAPFEFTMQADAVGDLRIDASLLSADVDDAPANDVAATIIRVDGDVGTVFTETDLKLVMGTDKDEYETGEWVRLSAQLINLGDVSAEDVTFNINVPAGLDVNTFGLPSACSLNGSLQCTFSSIESSDSELINIDLLSSQAGVFTLSASVGAGNDSNVSNNFDSDSLIVSTPVTQTTTSGSDSDGTSVGGSGSAGSTSGSSATSGSADTTSSVTDSGSGTSSGSTVGTTSGSTSGSTSTAGTTSQTTGAVVPSVGVSDAGAMTKWFVFLLGLLCLTRLYGGHQRQRVAVRH